MPNIQKLLTAGSVCWAYVFPRTMRLSYIMLPYEIVSASAGTLEEEEEEKKGRWKRDNIFYHNKQSNNTVFKWCTLSLITKFTLALKKKEKKGVYMQVYMISITIERCVTSMLQDYLYL